MNKVIGIISYLPDDSQIRTNRIDSLRRLISRINYLFNLPIIIVAQNWKDFKLNNHDTTIYYFDKLGIVGARNKLREIFLQQDKYDCLIMLDDDSVIWGDKSDADNYLKQLDNNPGMFYEFTGTLLKLFAISKDLFEKIDFNGVNPELGEGFEDRLFVGKLRKLYPEKRYIINKGKLYEGSISTHDPNSTWYKQQSIEEMLENTNKYLETKI